jgi:hypothetical protein
MDVALVGLGFSQHGLSIRRCQIGLGDQPQAT